MIISQPLFVPFRLVNPCRLTFRSVAWRFSTKAPSEVTGQRRSFSDANHALSTATGASTPKLPATSGDVSAKDFSEKQPIPVLITGGSGDISKAIALAFCSIPKLAFHITLVGRDMERLKVARGNLPKLSHPDWSHSIVEGDVANPEFWASQIWADNPNDGVIVPSILINAAGIVHRGLLPMVAPNLIKETVDVNLMSAIWGCKLFANRKLNRLRNKMRHDSGLSKAGYTPSIVNVGSLLSTHGGLGAAAYAASKAGLLGLTRALAAEYGRQGIRVNAIIPGFVESRMAREGEWISTHIYSNAN
jgi:NAD(P)-dependent dehydrogenase (short-subunit alcohol dehydrogenase family)